MQISETAKKWARHIFASQPIEGDSTDEVVAKIATSVQHAIDEAIQEYQPLFKRIEDLAFQVGSLREQLRQCKEASQGTDPLPVLKRFVAAFDNNLHGQAWFEQYQDAWIDLFDLIAQMQRERGVTEAAKHVKQLKEADNEPR